jgi:hypothetical protein
MLYYKLLLMSTTQTPKDHEAALASYILYSVFKEQHPTARDNHTSNCEPLTLDQISGPVDRLTGLSGPEGVGEADAYVNRVGSKESRHFFPSLLKDSEPNADRGREVQDIVGNVSSRFLTVVTGVHVCSSCTHSH